MIHAVCVGKQMKGWDIMCFDCVEDEELANYSEEKGNAEVINASVSGVVSYQLYDIKPCQQGKHCSHKKKRGYK